MEKELKKHIIRLDVAKLHFSESKEYLPTLNWEPLSFAMKDKDLLYGEGTVIVTQHANENGYFFTNEFIKESYKSFLLKPVNINHEDKNIIGVIYDVCLMDQNGFKLEEYSDLQTVEDELNIAGEKKLVRQDPFYVILKFVVFKWIYPEVSTDIVSKQMAGKPYGLSMEIYSYQSNSAENSTYGFIYDNNMATFDRCCKENMYLDEKVGKEYDGKKVSRVYTKGSFFGAVGIVDIPAESMARIHDLSSSLKDININVSTQLTQLAKKDLANAKQVPYYDGKTINLKLASISNNDNKRSNSMTEEEILAAVDSKVKQALASIEEEAKKLTDGKKAADESSAKTIILTERLTASVKDAAKFSIELENAKSKIDELNVTQTQLKETASQSKQELDKISKELETANAAIAEYKKIEEETKLKDLAKNRLTQLEDLGVKFKDEATKNAKLESFAKMTEDSWNTFFATIKDVTPEKPANKKDEAGLIGAKDFAGSPGIEGQEELNYNKPENYKKNMAGLSIFGSKNHKSDQETK